MIFNFYHPEFGCEDFLRIIDWMPYIVELDFDGGKLLLIKEHCHIEKEWGIIMKISEIQENQITDELIDEVIYSGLDYKNQHLDVAIILGSSKSHLYRVPYAVTEYKNGRIGKIIVSGGNVLPSENGMLEAEMMRETAVKMGVREEDIIVENKAATTVENMVFSRELIKRGNLLQKGIYIGIVTTAFHARRSIKIAQKIFAEDDVSIVILPGQETCSWRIKEYNCLC